MRVARDGVSLDVTVEGEGPAVVLLHGFPDSSRLWRHQIPALTEAGFRAVAPSLRGFGASGRPEGIEQYAMPLILGDVTGIMDALKIERAHIVGHDWGALVGWSLAAFQPERVVSLTAISVGHPAAYRRPFLPQLQKSWYLFLFQFPEVAEQALMRDDWRLFREWLHGAPDSAAYLEALSNPGALTAGLSWYRANAPPQIWANEPIAFPPVGCPTLGIFGTADPYLTEEMMLASEEHVSGAWRYERFEGDGHWLPLEKPGTLNALLIEFLRDHSEHSGQGQRSRR